MLLGRVYQRCCVPADAPNVEVDSGGDGVEGGRRCEGVEGSKCGAGSDDARGGKQQQGMTTMWIGVGGNTRTVGRGMACSGAELATRSHGA